MASIGHELKHALEVLENPGLVDATSVYFFYAERRHAKDRPFETTEAIDAGFAVRNEVSSFAKGRPNQPTTLTVYNRRGYCRPSR